MDIHNTFRLLLGKAIVGLVHYPWRISEKLLRKRFPVKGHYFIMKVFRALGHSFPVTISYPNPVAKGKKSITFALDLCENNQQWYFRLRGKYELEWVKLISLGMDNADSFIDIGANIGVFALTIAQAFPDRRVITLEPLASNYLILEKNIQLNHISNIEPLRVAVTDNKGLVSFYVNPIHDGGGSLIEPREYRTGDVRINAAKYQQKHPHFIPIVEVEGVSLDEIITNKSVLKIDVEGAEVTVLKSGMNALRRGLVDLMVLEVTNNTIDEAIHLLNDVGFDCFMYGKSSPITSVSQFNRRLGNVLCLRRQSPLYDSMVAKMADEEL